MFFLHCRGCCIPSAIGATTIGLTAAFLLMPPSPPPSRINFSDVSAVHRIGGSPYQLQDILRPHLTPSKPQPATSFPQPHDQQIIMNVDDYQQPCRPTLLDPSKPAKEKGGIFLRQANERTVFKGLAVHRKPQKSEKSLIMCMRLKTSAGKYDNPPGRRNLHAAPFHRSPACHVVRCCPPPARSEFCSATEHCDDM